MVSDDRELYIFTRPEFHILVVENLNSGDTGGILKDDWRSVNTDKQAVLHPLLAALIGSGGGTVNQPPATPTGLAASAGNQQVNLSWNGTAGAATYNVYRR